MASNSKHDLIQNDETAAAEAVRQGAEAAKQGGQAAGEATRRAADVGAAATRRNGEAGAAAFERFGNAAGDAVRRGAEDLADSQRELVQRAAERFQEVSQKVAEAAQSNAENLRALMTLPHAAQGGLQDLQQSVTGLVEGVVRTNLRATQELFQLANPAAYIELQQRFVREYLDALMEGTATLVRATRRTAEETLRPLEQQIEQRRRQQQDNQAGQAQRYRQAAE